MLHSTNNNVQPKRTSCQETGANSFSKSKAQKIKRRQKIDQLSDVDYVPTNTHSSHNESQMYIFEDNEAVIKMIMAGRSPTMRHVSKPTESLLIGFLTESIWNPKPKTNMLTPKNQLADILTKIGLSRGEWNQFLCLFSILRISRGSFVANLAFFFDNSDMSKRGQKTTLNEGLPTAKARPCLVARGQRSQEISPRNLFTKFGISGQSCECR